MSPAIKSYIRHALIAITPLLTTNDADWRHYAFAISLAIVGPLIRALDPADTAFGVSDDDVSR